MSTVPALCRAMNERGALELERSLAIRHLGEERGTAYFDSTEARRSASVLVIFTPERWLSVRRSRGEEVELYES